MDRKTAPLHTNGVVNEAHMEHARRAGQAQVLRAMFAALREAIRGGKETRKDVVVTQQKG